MKSFILKTSYIALLFFSSLLVVGLIWDPYKTIHSNQNWNATEFSFNREWVCLKIYNNRVETKKIPTHFIIGSSRSHAFKTNDWAKYGQFSPDSVFHFDAFGMGILRAHHLIEFLSKQPTAPKEIMWILDHTIFNETEESDRFIFSEPPAISGKNPIPFYAKALYESLHPSFLYRNLTSAFSFSASMDTDEEFTQKETVNPKTADIYYKKNDDHIVKDSIGFYNNKKLIQKFSKFSSNTETTSPPVIQESHLNLLKSIQKNLKKNNTKIKIIISPLYYKTKMNRTDLELLRSIFDEENIYDYSGLNSWTKDYKNYYDPSHFRPHIARQILKDIYSIQN